jgi:hypothetical protein
VPKRAASSCPHGKSLAVVDDDWPSGSPPGIVARYGGPGAAVEGGRRTVPAFTTTFRQFEV